MATAMSMDPFRAAITAAFPELSSSTFRLLSAGWDSTAVDVDDRLVFKFPRHRAAASRLAREATLLAVIRPAVTMTVPHLILHPGPPLFSRHEKIPGEHLVTAQYDRLPEELLSDLAEQMAVFYAELHGLDRRAMKAAGAGPIEAWLPPDEILARTLPVLPSALRRLAERTVAAWRNLPPDPYGTTYGFFDGHGWNMAFDHTRGRLNGIYDFADSGFGPLHQELVYTSFISPDLTRRIIERYEALTGRALDRRRIALLTGVHRLSELAALADDPAHVPAMVAHVADWAARRPLLGSPAW